MSEEDRTQSLRDEVQARLDLTYQRVTAQIAELQAEESVYVDGFDRVVRGQLLVRHRERIEEIMAIRNAAFIRRIDYHDQRESRDATMYIGAIPYESDGCSIVSWAAPIVGQLLYPPHTSQKFQAQAQKIIELNVSHRIIRKLAVTMDGYQPPVVAERGTEQATVHDGGSIHDVSLAGSGADAYLQHILQQKKHEQLGTIIQSIQHEQYQIIAAPVTKLKIIQGVPGAGKTVIALHRIAYLLFNNYKTTAGEQIAPEHVLFIGPNERFFEHVKNVLPTLGQREIRSRTPYALLETFRLTGGHRVRSPQENLDVMLSHTLLDPNSHVFERESLLGTLRMVDYIKHTVDKIIAREIQVCLATPLQIDFEGYGETCIRAGFFGPSTVEKARKEWKSLAGGMAEFLRFTEVFLKKITQRALVNVQRRYVLLGDMFRRVLQYEIVEKMQSEPSFAALQKLCEYDKQDRLVSELQNIVQRAVRRYSPVLPDAGSSSGILTAKKLLTAEDIRATRSKLERNASDTSDVMRVCGAMGDFVFRVLFNPEYLAAFFDQKQARMLSKHSGKIETTADVVLLSWIMCYLQKQLFVTGYASYTHVVCDEAQDMSPLFFDLLTRIFLRADFTLYGDMNQNILNYGTQQAWNEYFPIIANTQRTHLQLRHTYRSTAEIIRYATAILQGIGMFEGELPIPVIESGSVPEERQYSGVAELAEALVRLTARHPQQSIAVITKKRTTSEGLRTLITQHLRKTTGDGEPTFTFISIAEAKGLEYDVVFVIDVDARTYPEDLLHARLLYVATTRAAKQLYVLYDGERSALLPEKNEYVPTTQE